MRLESIQCYLLYICTLLVYYNSSGLHSLVVTHVHVANLKSFTFTSVECTFKQHDFANT